MNTRNNLVLLCTGLLLAITAATPVAGANLLVDPEFDGSPSLLSMGVVFPPSGSSVYGNWGAEIGAIVTAQDSVTPLTATTMLAEFTGSPNYTQTAQVTDVSAFTPGSSYTLSAYFNANVPAALAFVNMSFYDAAYTYLSDLSSSPGLIDSNPATWEQKSLTTIAPLTTKYIVSQVLYDENSITTNDGVIHAGYVDSASLTVVPEPGTLLLLSTGLAGLLYTTWRKRK
ncbi:MAG: PEP-CTERM sorting domain-containing protein [Pirellulales bacterium]|nr:PEP-CTERM sorting domain-containing protein [Pirellulales bacterium]